jgi:hypothetical protein
MPRSTEILYIGHSKSHENIYFMLKQMYMEENILLLVSKLFLSVVARFEVFMVVNIQVEVF